jgi:hypothetical protein
VQDGQEQAEAELRIAVNMDNWFSDLARKYLATSAGTTRGGRGSERSRQVSRCLAWKLTHGGRPLRLDSEYNDIVRAVARRVRSRSSSKPVRFSPRTPVSTWTFAHPDERGHRIVATLVNNALDSLLHPPQVAAQP